ncbi:MAG: tryptophan--tRNA ligase [Firmicutes bacterium]|nr:tryptophan--tRNA ligase [Bacillota bacterium]
MATTRKRVLSGMRPTGRLHIGHYFGALENWLKLQEQYDCYYFVADWHALTTDYADTLQVAQHRIEIVTDWLAVGLDPQKCTLFVQSWVPAHAELHLLLSMITPLGWLERVPTYKEQLEQLKDRDLHTYGFLGYPLLQTADIVLYDADFVPVGEDQVPHVELAREIVRRFNVNFGLEVKDELFHPENEAKLTAVLRNIPLKLRPQPGTLASELPSFYRRMIRSYVAEVGYENFLHELTRERPEAEFKRVLAGRPEEFLVQRQVLKEPDALLTEVPRLPGTDGRKMSKSYNNVIWLSESDDSIREKVRGMMTDPQRIRRSDPGRPEVCPVFAWHKLFSTPETIAWADRECRVAGIGCVDCKMAMVEGLIRWIEPIRARRQQYEAQPERVREILEEGSSKARQVTQETMGRVRQAVFGSEAKKVVAPQSGAVSQS